jgi:hypothetical protein
MIGRNWNNAWTAHLSSISKLVRQILRDMCETSTTDLTEGESGGNNRVVYMGKHSALYIHERTKQ